MSFLRSPLSKMWVECGVLTECAGSSSSEPGVFFFDAIVYEMCAGGSQESCTACVVDPRGRLAAKSNYLFQPTSKSGDGLSCLTLLTFAVDKLHHGEVDGNLVHKVASLAWTRIHKRGNTVKMF